MREGACLYNLTKPDISTGRERISNARTTVDEQNCERLMNADVQGKIGEVGLPGHLTRHPFAAGSRWSTSVLLRTGWNRRLLVRISMDG